MASDHRRRRYWFDRLMTLLMICCLVVVLLPLISILYTAVVNGAPVLSLTFLTASGPYPCSPGPGRSCQTGGIGPDLFGTLVLLGTATIVAVPFGIMTGIYLSEFGRNRFGTVVSFFTDVMTGIPSIVVGVFIYGFFLFYDRSIVFSATTGSLALAIIMIPVVTRTTQVALQLVPDSVREAALALGIPRYRATLHVILSAGRGAVVTGALLAAARAGGETAPLLFTAFGNPFGFQGYGQPTAAAPLAIFNYAFSPYANWHADAWGAALVMIGMMLGISVAARYALHQKFKGG